MKRLQRYKTDLNDCYKMVPATYTNQDFKDPSEFCRSDEVLELEDTLNEAIELLHIARDTTDRPGVYDSLTSFLLKLKDKEHGQEMRSAGQLDQEESRAKNKANK